MIFAFDSSGPVFPEFTLFVLLNAVQTFCLLLCTLAIGAYCMGRAWRGKKIKISATIPIVLLTLAAIAFVQLFSWNIVRKVSAYTQIGTATVASIQPVANEAKIILSDGSYFTNDRNVLYPVTPVIGDTVRLIHVQNGKKYAFVGKQGFDLNL